MQSFCENKNAFYKDRTGSNQVVLALDAEGGLLLRSAAHEVLHFLRRARETKSEWGDTKVSDDVKALKNFVVDYYKNTKGEEWLNEFLNKNYDKRVYDTEDKQIEEFVADNMFDALNSDRAIKELYGENPTLAQKVWKHIQEVTRFFAQQIKEMSGKGIYGEIEAMQNDLDTLNEINNRFFDILNENKGLAVPNKNTATQAADETYSIKRTRNMSWQEQTNKLFDSEKYGSLNRGDSLYVGDVVKDKKAVGLSDAPFIIHTGDISKSEKGGIHGVKKKFFKNLPTHISDSVMYIERDNGELTVITDQMMLDTKGKPSLIIAGIHRDETLDDETVNRVASVYPLDNLTNQLFDASNSKRLIITDKNRANDILAGVGIPSSERTKIISSAVDNITQVSKQSQEENSNSTKRDREYFSAIEKYGEDSKEVAELVEQAAEEAGYDSPNLWHGTEKFGFTEFDLDKLDDKQSIFLTSKPEMAASYSGASGTRRISEEQDIKRSFEKLKGYDLVNKLNLLFNEVTGSKNSSVFEYLSKSELDERIKDYPDVKDYLIKGLQKVSEELKSDTASDSDVIRAHVNSAVDMLKADKISQATSEWNSYATQVLTKEQYHDLHPYLVELITLQNIYKLPEKIDADGGVILGWGDPLTKEEARKKLPAIRRGNYSLKAKLGKSLVIDAKGANWNAVPFNVVKLFDIDQYTFIDMGEYYRLINRNSGDWVEDGRWSKSYFRKMSDYNKILQKLYDMTLAEKERWNKGENVRTRDIAKWAKEGGYDSVVFKNLHDDGGRGNGAVIPAADVYVIFDPNSVKSLDPVTRDDEGNIIPLSERFNQKNEDIRYSTRRDDKWNKHYLDLDNIRELEGEELTQKANEFLKSNVLTGYSERGKKTVFKYVSKEELKKYLDEIKDIHNLEDLDKSELSEEAYSLAFDKFFADKDIGKLQDAYIKYHTVEGKKTASFVTKQNIYDTLRDSEPIFLSLNKGKVYTAAEVKEVFDESNTDEELQKLAEKVFDTCEKLGVRFKVEDDNSVERFKTEGNKVVGGVAGGLRVIYNDRMINSRFVPIQTQMDTLLHEAIHATTVYALVSDTSRDRNGNYEMKLDGKRFSITEEQAKAIDILQSTYISLIHDSELLEEYGMTNEREFVAELSNPDFRKKLKLRNVWSSIVDAIKRFFGIKVSTAYDAASSALDYLLENYNEDAARAYDEGFVETAEFLGQDEWRFSKKRDSSKPVRNPQYTEKEIINNCIKLQEIDSVKELSGNEFSREEDKSLRTQIKEYFESIGNVIKTDKYGDVYVTNNSIRAEIRHGLTRAKIVSFVAIPDVLQKGVVIDSILKSKNLERTVVAAPIEIKGEKYYVGVMFQKSEAMQRLYIHDVVAEKETALVSTGHSNNNEAGEESDNLFLTTILQKALNVKRGDEIPSTRRDIEYNYLENATPEELEAVEAEVDRRMAEKDEEVVSLNNQIAELTAQRDELIKNEQANRDEIIKLNNRIDILKTKLERRRKEVTSLQGKLRRRDAKVDRLTEQMREARKRINKAAASERLLKINRL